MTAAKHTDPKRKENQSHENQSHEQPNLGQEEAAEERVGKDKLEHMGNRSGRDEEKSKQRPAQHKS